MKRYQTLAIIDQAKITPIGDSVNAIKCEAKINQTPAVFPDTTYQLKNDLKSTKLS